MSLLIVIPNRDTTKLEQKLFELLPGETIEVWPNVQDFDAVTFVLAWLPPEDIWQQLPNVRAISSFGAGVDGLLSDAVPDVPIARIVDSMLAHDMAEYVLGHILAYKLRVSQYLQQQQGAHWYPKRAHQGRRVGILGFGQLGQKVAEVLVENNFVVSAWSKNEKNHQTVTCFYGDEGLLSMASESDYLVCLLPLTIKTQGVLNQQLFSVMPNHSVLINVGRGKHLIEDDLFVALQKQTISHAILDVFTIEPLPADHPFWRCKQITITPHASALTDINTVVAQIADNYQRSQSGNALINCINRKNGY
ncbi:2-hydroxyacid dehydrogenase [Pseudoalteromonas tunicata]|uniref:Putative dehydrogenase n=1 Tax=Pseudoalteromonas tunicata D2 TaxID=87626 RepID=A4C638_9GAMM|nr:glyoxylate/hydroxypyruvate reductase A [Pseudoalteromonas tunicata]ATC95415.1 gyoxylate/hydroxypyruvate reductase A [Pseudoalteromonas tunicata]AXT30995.1 glyoxylate/hydroxypyruvate reductase A [Pseudoalteromonas tunicata]EAR29442.1 putative dehydrogenase [Pseudoalteromonas tunicata D2]